jgi:hypothetical protein
MILTGGNGTTQTETCSSATTFVMNLTRSDQDLIWVSVVKQMVIFCAPLLKVITATIIIFFPLQTTVEHQFYILLSFATFFRSLQFP